MVGTSAFLAVRDKLQSTLKFTKAALTLSFEEINDRYEKHLNGEV
jgi:hypothetical protein